MVNWCWIMADNAKWWLITVLTIWESSLRIWLVRGFLDWLGWLVDLVTVEDSLMPKRISGFGLASTDFEYETNPWWSRYNALEKFQTDFEYQTGSSWICYRSKFYIYHGFTNIRSFRSFAMLRSPWPAAQHRRLGTKLQNTWRCDQCMAWFRGAMLGPDRFV